MVLFFPNLQDIEFLPTAVAEELPLEERPTPIIAFEEPDSNVVEIQPLAYNSEVKNKAMTSAVQGMITLILMCLTIIICYYFALNDGIMENPWIIVPQLFFGSFAAGIGIPMLWLYWNKNMRNHCLGLMSNVFPCSTSNMVDVIV